jgi:hypothetical protein
MENQTHWKKKFNYDYLGSYSIEGKDLILTIREVRTEPVKGSSGRAEDCLVCHFVEDQKPMILNRTNCKTIEKVYKTGFIEEWRGLQIQIYVQKDVAAFGDTVDALRIRPKRPQVTLPALDSSHKAWQNVVAHLSKGNPISDVLKKYTLTEEVKAQLLAEAYDVKASL